MKQIALVWIVCTSAWLVTLPAGLVARESGGSPAVDGSPVTSTGVDAASLSRRMMLSGEGIEDAVPWEFMCTDGRRAGTWTTIPVPSLWEQHGFGNYNYGHDDDPSREQGLYRHRFQVPADWQGLRVELVFEGVMTDAEVTVNGRSAGAVHQGAFYVFRYDVGELLNFGGDNLLEVTVSKHSADKKVNLAERDADYWIFGGIFRPVYLQAQGRESVDRWAIDARHDGSFEADIMLHAVDSAAELVWSVSDLAGRTLGTERRQAVAAGSDRVTVRGTFPEARAWSAETPHLHLLDLELRRGETVLHRAQGRFGFRTFEVRRDQGLFVNGRRVRLKGINRHVFWPSSGRTSWPRRDRLDVEQLKALNLNAVRTAHYPPDRAFLDACDARGIYVLNELGGWHDAYGTEHGKELVQAMVTRDVNHPSILFWNNGNEGGWNEDLVEEFGRWDPQQRPVLHPDALLGDVQTQHYPNWAELMELLDESTWRDRWFGWRAMEPPLIMPTEILHGLYDGGSGAGLAAYWQRLRDHPLGAGTFLWSFTDESIERSDRDGALDSDGNHAPDGVLGPYREWSGTASAVREVFAPIRAELSPAATSGSQPFDGTVRLWNDFDHLPLSRCRFAWYVLDLPGGGEAAETRLVTWGELAGPAVAAGDRGTLQLPWAWPDGNPPGNALRLTAFDPSGRDVATWTWPLRRLFKESASVAEGTPEVQIVDGVLRLGSDRHHVELDVHSGTLLAFASQGQRLDLPGPRVLGESEEMSAAVLRHGPLTRLNNGVETVVEGAYAVDVAPGEGPMHRLRWVWHEDGWMRLSFLYEHRDRTPYHGVDFALDAARIQGLDWLGHGPFRIWGNRREGTDLGVWSKQRPGQTEAIWAHEPKFDGYYGGVRWAHVRLAEGTLHVAFEEPGIDLGMSTPAFPEDSEEALAEVPVGGLSLLREIPPIGTKFHAAETLLPPASQPAGRTLVRGTVWLRWSPGSEKI